MSSLTKVSAIARIKTLLTDPINSLTKWAVESDPTGTLIDPANPTLQNYVPNALTLDLVTSQTVYELTPSDFLTQPGLNNIRTIEFVNTLKWTTVALSKCRLVQLQKLNYPYTVAYFDSITPANMNANFEMAFYNIPNPDIGVLSGNITDAGLVTYIAVLNTTLSTWRDNILVYQENYCHSNCHSNCHSSRGRR